MYTEKDQRNDHKNREDIRVVVREAVKETFILLGLNISDPLEVQKDMSYLREWRKNIEQIKRNSLFTLCGIIILGTITLIWTNIKG